MTDKKSLIKKIQYFFSSRNKLQKEIKELENKISELDSLISTILKYPISQLKEKIESLDQNKIYYIILKEATDIQCNHISEIISKACSEIYWTPPKIIVMTGVEIKDKTEENNV